MLIGDFEVKLDDTFRICLPRSIRDDLHTTTVYVSRGEEGCLWLFSAERFEKLVKTVIAQTNDPQAKEILSNPYFQEGRHFMRRLLGTGQKLDIDKMGRIVIPGTLRDYAGLSKECQLLGLFDYIEIWDKERYQSYLDASEEDYKTASRELGARIKSGGELGEYGNKAHSSSSGGNNTIPRPEGQL